MERIARLWRENWSTILLITGLIAAYLVLRTPQSDIASVEEFQQRLAQGQPTVVEFYNNT